MSDDAPTAAKHPLEDHPLPIASSLPCAECRRLLAIGHGATGMFEAFFEGDCIACGGCGEAFDLWDRCSAEMTERHMFGLGPSLMGAAEVFFTFRLSAHEYKRLDLAAHGVPADVEIISVNLTVSAEGSETGSVHPAERHTLIQSRRKIPHTIHVQGYPLGQPDRPSLIFTRVHYHAPPDQNDGWRDLLDAWSEYEAGDFRGVIVPANIAAESAIRAAAKAAFTKLGTPKKAEASYEALLDTELPGAVSACSLPGLDARVVGELHRLRKLRNQIGHAGAPKGPLPVNAEIAAMLAAAVFGFRYGRHIAANA